MSIYIKLEVDTPHHPKAVGLPASAFALYVKGLCYAKRYLTDGDVPRAALAHIANGHDDPEGDASRLVTCGLWRVTPTGWTVGTDNWARHQTTRDDVEAKRLANAERQRKWREKRQQDDALQSNAVTQDVTPASRVTNASRVQSTETEYRGQSTSRESPNSTPPDEAIPTGVPTASAPPRKARKSSTVDLDAMPLLRDSLEALEALVLERHPFAKPAPAWRRELADAVRLDGVPEADLVAAIRWTFQADHEDARFWRKQIQGFGGLRSSKGGKPSKLSRILNAWAASGGKRRAAPTPEPEADDAAGLPEWAQVAAYRIVGLPQFANGSANARDRRQNALAYIRRQIEEHGSDAEARISALDARHSPNGGEKVSGQGRGEEKGISTGSAREAFAAPLPD